MWELCCFKAKPRLRDTATATITASATKAPPIPDSPSRNEDSHRHPAAKIGTSALARTSIMLAAASWLRMRRSRCLIFLVCSPLLLPFLCATFPILCAAELCLRLFFRRKSSLREDEECLRRCEEGFGDREAAEKEVSLLQRYLEDQLLLVGSVYDCGDGDEDDYYTEIIDDRIPLLN